MKSTKTSDWEQARHLFPKLTKIHDTQYPQRYSTRNGWQLGPSACKAMCNILRPGMKTLECGSGLSTYIFVALGCDHTALEHQSQFAPPWSCVKIYPLNESGWYDWEPEDQYDFILIDGPSIRNGIIEVIEKITHKDTILLIDDTNRKLDNELCKTIASQLNRKCVTISNDDSWDFGKQSTLLLPQNT